MKKAARIFLAEGFEESEAIVPFDVLHRGGVDVEFVAVGDSLVVRSSHGVEVVAQRKITDALDNYDLLMLPGGMPGTSNLMVSQELRDELVVAADGGKIISAICAAPTVLASVGLLDGRRATCYPGFESEMYGVQLACDEGVVCDGPIITGKGAGVAFDFGLELLAALQGRDVADRVRGQMIY